MSENEKLDAAPELTEEEQKLKNSDENEPRGEKAWFVVSTYSTHEMKAKENLDKRVVSMGIQDLVFRVLVPQEEVQVMRNGVPTGKTRMKNLYPGYIYVEMIMTDWAWYVVRNTPGVTGFVGSSGKGTKPFPVPRDQIEPVLKRMGIVDNTMYDRYNVGDYVKVISGPLEGTEGTIVSINKETGAVEFEAIFFGRRTKAEVEFAEIEKI